MNRKKVLLGLGIFLGVMLLCTLVSRGIYASMLPQVTLEQPRRSSIAHRVSAEGNVRQGRELAQTVKAGIRVSEVLVVAGDSVTAGQPLFLLDQEHIRKLLEENEFAINKQRLDLATLQHNVELAAEEKNREMIRAGEDYLQAKEEAELILKRAQEDEEQAQQDLARIEEKMPENGEEDPEYEQWETMWRAQLDVVKEAERALEDARNNIETTQNESDRNLEEALSQVMTDASMGTSRMELDALYEQRRQLQALLDTEGVVTAERDCVVTELFVSAGEYTPEGSAILFADAQAPFYFSVMLDAKQKKYVEPGMEAQVTLGNVGTAGKEVTLTVDYLLESKTQPGTYQCMLTLPQGVGRIGQTGTFEVTVQSQIYNCCVPTEALHQDENANWFVYAMEERPTMLGKEPVAARIGVKVLDQNERTAALEAGAVDENTQLIVATTKEFEQGDVVRKKE